MTAEIIDFQKYRDRKLREQKVSEPIPEAEIQQREIQQLRQSQKINGEPGGDGSEDGPRDGDPA